MLVHIISDPGDQNGRIKFLPGKYAGIRMAGGMTNNKNGLVFWTGLNRLAKWSIYHVRIALYCIASRKTTGEMVWQLRA